MLSRYQMRRGARAADLPAGRRVDTRKHTKHCLRPSAAMVEAYLADPTDAAWRTFRDAYRDLVDARVSDNRAPFDDLAARARDGDVHLGCSCPTARNPDVRRCHTWLALELMSALYPDLAVVFPDV